MNKLIEFNVAGGTVVVETEEVATGSVVRGAGVAQLIEKVDHSLEDALRVIRPVAEAAMNTCAGLVPLPDAVEIEFGLKFTLGLDAILAKSCAEASVLIKLVMKPT